MLFFMDCADLSRICAFIIMPQLLFSTRMRAAFSGTQFSRESIKMLCALTYYMTYKNQKSPFFCQNGFCRPISSGVYAARAKLVCIQMAFPVRVCGLSHKIHFKTQTHHFGARRVFRDDLGRPTPWKTCWERHANCRCRSVCALCSENMH